MKSVGEVLVSLGACSRAIQKYIDCYDLKEAFINCNWRYGMWIANTLFNFVAIRNYPNLPKRGGWVDRRKLESLFRKKVNRIKYWPEVEQRLGEMGFEIRSCKKTDHKTRDARAAKKTPGRGA